MGQGEAGTGWREREVGGTYSWRGTFLRKETPGQKVVRTSPSLTSDLRHGCHPLK